MQLTSTRICLYSSHTHLREPRTWVQMEAQITHLELSRLRGRPGGCSALEPSRQDGQAWSGRQDLDHKQGQQSGVKHLRHWEA